MSGCGCVYTNIVNIVHSVNVRVGSFSVKAASSSCLKTKVLAEEAGMGAMRELNSTNPRGRADKLFGKAITEKAKIQTNTEYFFRQQGRGVLQNIFRGNRRKALTHFPTSPF